MFCCYTKAAEETFLPKKEIKPAIPKENGPQEQSSRFLSAHILMVHNWTLGMPWQELSIISTICFSGSLLWVLFETSVNPLG